MNTTAEDLVNQAVAAMAAGAARKSTPDDPIHYLPSGQVQVRLAGKTGGIVLLPRPTFGQIKRLIRSEGTMTDRVNALLAEARSIAKDLVSEGNLAGLTESTEHLEKLKEIRDKSRTIADDATDAVAEALGTWWTEAFAILELDDPPAEDNWPSEFLDASLPGRLISHWRYAPAGPG